ncbi:MAG: triose-phosphate isomerase [Chlamydiae bacterium]|nr:triose-phosphate isomerase [Chlamydiota bacterium]
MIKQSLIIGNWKMHKTIKEAEKFIAEVNHQTKESPFTVMIAVPYPFLYAASNVAKKTNIAIGSQNICEHREGPFTGEVSAKMVKDAGGKFSLIGHSERRKHYHETDGQVHQKILRALEEKLTPVLCVGESLDERREEKTKEVLSHQITRALLDFSKDQIKHLVIAYEPVWAIGTGKSATPEMAEEAHQFIYELLQTKFGKDAADSTFILYGGSVNIDNAAQFMQVAHVDGVLIGGASLDVSNFAKIISLRK